MNLDGRTSTATRGVVCNAAIVGFTQVVCTPIYTKCKITSM
jgi:hypothetical protein